jgi:hypothetical protein
MPTSSRREDAIVEAFLSRYEDGSWADARLEWLDKIMDGAVEVRATRSSDGKRVAVEHTIIEPFTGGPGWGEVPLLPRNQPLRAIGTGTSAT